MKCFLKWKWSLFPKYDNVFYESKDLNFYKAFWNEYFYGDFFRLLEVELSFWWSLSWRLYTFFWRNHFLYKIFIKKNVWFINFSNFCFLPFQSSNFSIKTLNFNPKNQVFTFSNYNTILNTIAIKKSILMKIRYIFLSFNRFRHIYLLFLPFHLPSLRLMFHANRCLKLFIYP